MPAATPPAPPAPPAPPTAASNDLRFAYQFYHIGLTPKCPLGAVTLAGHSFQKESWVYNETGDYSAEPGLIIRLEYREGDKAALEEFEKRIESDASRYVIRVALDPQGKITRADLVFKDHLYRPNRHDVPLSNYVYIQRKDEGRFTVPPTLTNKPTRIPELSRERVRKAKKDAGVLGPDDLED